MTPSYHHRDYSCVWNFRNDRLFAVKLIRNDDLLPLPRLYPFLLKETAGIRFQPLHGLVIGQAPVTSSSGVSDNGEVPSWWFPGGSSPRSSMSSPPREPPPPTRSGSNPDDIQAAVVLSQPGIYPEPSSPSQGKAAGPAHTQNEHRLVKMPFSRAATGDF
jgi:hypothetical protein